MTIFDYYLPLLGVMVFIGLFMKQSGVGMMLWLVVAGMLFSMLDIFPPIMVNSQLILEIFLPLLIYQMSVETSWRDIKVNVRQILSLSFGHVLFIAGIVAMAIHYVLPELGWPLAFLLGAVVSPPDDVAIIPIAEKGHLPNKIVTLLKSEAMFNDAMALILFRFSLAAVVTHQFFIVDAVINFVSIVVGETIYGVLLGWLIGYIRLKIDDPRLHVILSLMTPFLAYLPTERLGGCGILAVAVTGIVIGHQFFEKFTPQVRLVAGSVWGSLSFILQGLLFILIGLDLKFILERISSISVMNLLYYSMVVLLTVIVGRFLWVFTTFYLPRKIFTKGAQNKQSLPWQHALIVSWSGMRGAISLAAVLAVPTLPWHIEGANVRDLLIFIVFFVICATLILQGLTLLSLINWLGIKETRQKEQLSEKWSEKAARASMLQAALDWLIESKTLVKGESPILSEINYFIKSYKMLLKQDKKYQNQDSVKKNLRMQVLNIERNEMNRLWKEEKITLAVRNKLMSALDHSQSRLEENE